MKKKEKSIWIYVVIGVVVAFGINYGMGFAFATNYPIVAVKSDSMVPVFHRGDVLLVKGSGIDGLEIGDIVVFSVPTRSDPIVHRLVEKNPDNTIRTKGDANSASITNIFDETQIREGQIQGKVIFILPYLGFVKIGITEALSSPLILYSAIAVISGTLLIYIYYNTIRRRNKIKKK